jgi:hypothetical protein
MPVMTEKRVLSEHDAKRVLSLLEKIDDFAGIATGIYKKTVKREKQVSWSVVKKVRDAWYRDNTILNLFLQHTSLSEDDRALIKKWQLMHITADFICLGFEETGAVFYYADNVAGPLFYIVRGITTDLQKIINKPLPVQISARLLPFNNVIITDGLFALGNTLPDFLADTLQEEWRKAQEEFAQHKQHAAAEIVVHDHATPSHVIEPQLV